jgi:hypothetical protein
LSLAGSIDADCSGAGKVKINAGFNWVNLMRLGIPQMKPGFKNHTELNCSLSKTKFSWNSKWTLFKTKFKKNSNCHATLKFKNGMVQEHVTGN